LIVAQNVFYLILLDFVELTVVSSLCCTVSSDAAEHVGEAKVVTAAVHLKWEVILGNQLHCSLMNQKKCLAQIFIVIDFVVSLVPDLFQLLDNTPGNFIVIHILQKG
jgi:hypothetical protein